MGDRRAGENSNLAVGGTESPLEGQGATATAIATASKLDEGASSTADHSLTPASPPVPAVSDRQTRRRSIVCFGCALTLHAGATLFTPENPRRLTFAQFHAPELSTFIDVDIDAPHSGTSQPPGGGSDKPKPDGAEEARPKPPRPAPRKAAAVAPAPEVHRDTRLAEVAPETVPVPDPETVLPNAEPVPDAVPVPATIADTTLLASEDLEALDQENAVRPSPIRHAAIASAARATATAPNVAAGSAQQSRHYGVGPGRGGGPGGVGRGWGSGTGVVNERFAFGGPTGAFRADVCFIPEHTRSLSTIRDCPREATFFTNSLDVAPRRFNAGFPGVTTRSEWFAIRYQGKFTVTTAGQYYFRLISDDGAKLWVDGFLIVDLDGTHPPASKDGNMRLMEGEHSLFVAYFQGPRDNIALQLFVTPPDGAERILTPRI